MLAQGVAGEGVEAGVLDASAAGYVVGSVFASLVALFVGLALFERRIPLP